MPERTLMHTLTAVFCEARRQPPPESADAGAPTLSTPAATASMATPVLTLVADLFIFTCGASRVMTLPLPNRWVLSFLTAFSVPEWLGSVAGVRPSAASPPMDVRIYCQRMRNCSQMSALPERALNIPYLVPV
ncbi:hypothetical protein GCM10020358_59180 [Amorphoplanes nipponensis]